MRKYITWALQHFLLSRLMLDLNPQSTFSALQYPLIIMSLAQRQIKIKQSPLISHFRCEVYFLLFAGNGVNSIEESHLIRQREFSNYATCQDWNLWDCQRNWGKAGKQLHAASLTLLCHYHSHLDIAKCKSSKHPEVCFMINTERQLSEEISAFPISIFRNQFSKTFLIRLLKTT